MACRKYTISNNGSFTQTYTYQECNNLMWNYDFTIEPGQIRTIWLINGTYTAPATSTLSVTDDGLFPPIISPTPTHSVTPTNTPTPSITPTITVTPSITSSITPTPTSTTTPTPSVSTTVTPTPTITTTPTPSITTTPTPTPTPSSTPTIQGFFFTLQEVGPDVVLSGTGSVNLSSLTSFGVITRLITVVDPSNGEYNVGAVGGAVEFFSGTSLSIYPSFGSGGANGDLSSGDLFGPTNSGVMVPYPYTGAILNGTATFTGTTLSTLGVTVPGGPYLIQWGASGASETITLTVI